MWLKRLFGRDEEASPSGQASGTQETEQSREDRQATRQWPVRAASSRARPRAVVALVLVLAPQPP